MRSRLGQTCLRSGRAKGGGGIGEGLGGVGSEECGLIAIQRHGGMRLSMNGKVSRIEFQHRHTVKPELLYRVLYSTYLNPLYHIPYSLSAYDNPLNACTLSTRVNIPTSSKVNGDHRCA